MKSIFHQGTYQDNDDKYSKWNAYSSVVAAITGALTLIVQLSTGLPFQNWWFAVVPGMLLLPFLVISIPKIWNWINASILENKIAKTNRVKLLNFLSEFHEHMGTNSATNIIFALSSINDVGYKMQKREFAELCEMFVNDLRERIQKNSRSYAEFRKTLLQFGVIIIKFEQLYFNTTMHELKKLDANVVSEDTLKKIESARQNFVNFLDRFRSFCSELNEHLGRKDFGYYFNIPRQL